MIGRTRLRPTLRLRLTLLNGVLLVGAGAVLVLLAWLLVRDALRPADERELLVKALVALVAIGMVGVAGAYAVAGRALRPLHQVTATARRLGETTLDERIGWSGANDEVAARSRRRSGSWPTPRTSCGRRSR